MIIYRIGSLVAATATLVLTIGTLAFAEITPAVINAVIYAESAHDPHATSVDGCRGLGQIQKDTWYWACAQLGESWAFSEAYDPVKNRIVTEFYLNWLAQYLKKRGHYSLDLVFACYNAGPGTVKKCGWQVPPYRETRQYIKKINAYLQNDTK